MQLIQMPENTSLHIRNAEEKTENNFVYDNNKNASLKAEPRYLYGENKFSDIFPGDVILLDHLVFLPKTSIIADSSFNELDALVNFLKENSGLIVEIQAHTFLFDDKFANQALSEKQALSVYNYLQNKGIQKEKMIYNGYGDAKPLKIDDSKLNPTLYKNRVELLFYSAK